MNIKNNQLIFVYGTLVKGGRLHYNIEGAEYIGDYALEGYAMYSIMGRYPGIISAEGETTLGEVYEISYDNLRRLDIVEGDDYHRITVDVSDIAMGGILKCKTYIYTRQVDIADKIPENIWKEKHVKALGYGSLMNTSDFMRMYSPEEQKSIKKVGNGILKGYKLGYTYRSTGRKGGVLDVVRGSLDDYVIGVVNELPFELLTDKIDSRENNGKLYQREMVRITINGKPEAAFCYFIMDHRRDYNGVAPHDDYNQIVLKGMRENNFPDEYISKYVQYVKELNNSRS